VRKFTLAGPEAQMREDLNMVPVLSIIGIAAVLVIGGTVVSLFLYTQGFAGRTRRVRRLDMAMAEQPVLRNANIADSEMTQYARRALVALLFAMLMLILVVTSMIHALLR
jgi:hypothetical protein